MAEAVAQAGLVDHGVEPLRVGLAAGDRERQEHVLARVEHRQQVEELEHEADVVPPQPGQLVVAELRDVGALTSTVPSVGLSSPARMCISVDLPDPDGPITAVSLPRSISTETSRSAVTAVSPSPKRRLTPDAVTTGPASSVLQLRLLHRPRR